MSQIPPRTGEQAPGARLMVALLLPLFASLMSISSVMVALPAIEEGIGASSSDLQWVLSGYALAFGVGLVPAGRAGDLWGRRRVFLCGVAIFAMASLATAFAPNPLLLNLLRIIGGLGAAMLVPQIIGMIQRLFVGAARGRAYGLMSTVIGVAVAVGPLVGGALIDSAPADIGWRLVFLINVPVSAAGLLCAFLWLPAPADDHQHRPGGIRRLDPLGAVVLTVAIVLLMLPFIQYTNLFGVVLALAGLGVLAFWVYWEKRLGDQASDAPMVNLGLFTLPSYTWNSAVLVLYFAGMPGIWAVVAIYIQQGLGEGAFMAGLVTLPSAAMVTLFAAYVGKRVERAGPRMLVAGAVMAMVSMLALAGAAALAATGYGSLWWVALSMGISGFAQALIIPSAQTLSMRDVPEYMSGAAGGVAQSAQRVVTAIGLAVVTAIYYFAADEAGHQGGIIASAVAVAAVMVATIITAVKAGGSARRA